MNGGMSRLYSTHDKTGDYTRVTNNKRHVLTAEDHQRCLQNAYTFIVEGQMMNVLSFKKRTKRGELTGSCHPFNNKRILKTEFLLEWSVRCVTSFSSGCGRPALLSMWGRTSWPVPLPSSRSPSCSDSKLCMPLLVLGLGCWAHSAAPGSPTGSV